MSVSAGWPGKTLGLEPPLSHKGRNHGAQEDHRHENRELTPIDDARRKPVGGGDGSEGQTRAHEEGREGRILWHKATRERIDADALGGKLDGQEPGQRDQAEVDVPEGDVEPRSYEKGRCQYSKGDDPELPLDRGVAAENRSIEAAFLRPDGQAPTLTSAGRFRTAASQGARRTSDRSGRPRDSRSNTPGRTGATLLKPLPRNPPRPQPSMTVFPRGCPVICLLVRKKNGMAANSATILKAMSSGSDTPYRTPITTLPRNQKIP